MSAFIIITLGNNRLLAFAEYLACYVIYLDVGVKRVCKNSLTYHIVP